MADIVNLRLARKRAERARRDATAAENRTLHGRTRAEKQSHALEKRRAAAALDGHLRDMPGRDRED